MINTWDGGRQKTKVGDEIILKLMDSVYSVNNEVEFSLRAFGHQSTVDQNDCHDTRNEVPFRKDNRLQMEYRLEDLKPLGVTSIAYALQEAAINDLVDIAHNAYSIILITDGGESCGGDICEVMRRLIQNKVFFKPYIVSLESTPGLKKAYECMGNYLEVTKQADIDKAIGVIVEAFTPILSLKTAEYTAIKSGTAKAPTVLNVTIPTIKITDTVKTTVADVPRVPLATTVMIKAAPQPSPARPTTIPGFAPEVTEAESLPTFAVAKATPAGLTPMDIGAPKPQRLRQVTPPAFEPVIKEEAPERPTPETVVRVAFVHIKEIAVAPKTTSPKPTDVLKYGSVVIIETPEKPAPEVIAHLPLSRLKTFNIIFVIDENDTKFPYRKPPPAPPLKFDAEPKPTPKTAVKPNPGVKPLDGKPADFSVETEDAKETTLEVYFTNGKGKFYATTPQVVLIDPATGKMVRRFYRMVDENGNPDPQKDIPPGTYHLTFTETRSTVAYNVTVLPNKRNKINVVVNKASLSFEYANNPTRPVSEFSALMKELFKENGMNGKVTTQKCTERLEYEPGNYHVIINTFPQDVRNLDLDFDEKVIKIPQPGFVKFVADESMNSVELYQRLGDKFLRFHIQNLKDPVAQHLRIQPGEYQAHYHKGPGGSSASEKVVTFIVKATEEVEVVLK